MGRTSNEKDLKNRQGHFCLLVLGFTSILTLNAFILWGNTSFFYPLDAWNSANTFFSSTCSIANTMTFFAIGLAAFFFPTLFQRKFFLPGSLFLVSSFSLLFLPYSGKFESPEILVLAGILSGAGSACLLITWEQIFSEQSSIGIHRIILASSALTIIPYLMILLVPDNQVLFVLSFVLLPLCIGTLYGSMKLPADEALVDSAPLQHKARYRSSLSTTWVSLPCILAFGLISPLIGAITLDSVVSAVVPTLLAQSGNAAAVIVLFLIWRKLKTYPTIPQVFVISLPVLSIALIFVPFFGQDYRYAVLFIGALAFTLVSILVMVSCIDIAEDNHISLVVTYCLFAGVLYISRNIGELIANGMTSSDYSQSIQFISIAFFLVYTVSMVGFIAFHSISKVQETINQKAKKPAQVPLNDLEIRCRYVAEKYRLSARETEVLEMLARGRTIPAIAEKLCLSENTIRSHTKRLYIALNVHSKQELIDVLESSTPHLGLR